MVAVTTPLRPLWAELKASPSATDDYRENGKQPNQSSPDLGRAQDGMLRPGLITSCIAEINQQVGLKWDRINSSALNQKQGTS